LQYRFHLRKVYGNMNPNAKEAIFFMGKVKVIPVHPKYLVKRYKKVAAYCRVSTAQEIQYHSLEAQREHFEKYIGTDVVGVRWNIRRPSIGAAQSQDERVSAYDGRLPCRED
jgi:hypothetical protein